ncbi:MAG TPA: M28 family peptidase, partial [Kofleriaceae bacterium]
MGCHFARGLVRMRAMQSMTRRVLLVLLCASCATAAQPRAAATDAPPFDVAQLRADIGFLANDLLEGRRAGTRGYDVAAAYVAARLAILGIAPGGKDGYFQPLQLREVVPDLAATKVELSNPALAAAVRVPDSATVSADLAHLDLDVTGKLTFVGKGVCDPETGRDDAAGADLTGRWAVTLAGVAEGLPPARAGVRSDTSAKYACVAKHGAIGLVVLRTSKGATLRWSSTVASYRSGAMGILDGDTARSRSLPAPVVVLDTLRIRYHGEAHDARSVNVIGRIPGSDPQLAREAVVVSAHLDHLGVDASGGIRNGAIDNASGSAQLLAIARALTALPKPPRRTVILLFTTGEELGLLGAEGFVAHPTWPLPQIVADINIDQTGMMWPIADVVADGSERSSLAGPAGRAAAALGLAVSPDPVPEQGFFLRSD